MERGGKGNRLEAGRCRHVQISGRFSIAEWDQAVTDILAATEDDKFLPK
jgi:hypothetical protein